MHVPDFDDRPRLRAFEDFRYPDAGGNVKGVIFGNGPGWRNLRRFTLKSLRDLGMGKDATLTFVQEEVEKLCQRYAKTYLHIQL